MDFRVADCSRSISSVLLVDVRPLPATYHTGAIPSTSFSFPFGSLNLASPRSPNWSRRRQPGTQIRTCVWSGNVLTNRWCVFRSPQPILSPMQHSKVSFSYAIFPLTRTSLGTILSNLAVRGPLTCRASDSVQRISQSSSVLLFDRPPFPTKQRSPERKSGTNPPLRKQESCKGGKEGHRILVGSPDFNTRAGSRSIE